MNPTHIEHIGIAVTSLEEAIPFFETLLGTKCYAIEEVVDQKVKTAFLRCGQTKIELLEPTSPESTIAAFIEKNNGKGVSTIKITERTGKLIAIKAVTDDDDLMIINRSGIAIRLHVDQLRILGRNTQGVKLIDLRGKDMIAAVCEVPRQEDEDIEGVETTENPENGELNGTPEPESEA